MSAHSVRIHRYRRPVNITLPPDLIEKARIRTNNLSRLVEGALRRELEDGFSANAFSEKGLNGSPARIRTGVDRSRACYA